MKEFIFYSDSSEATKRVGFALGRVLVKGDIVLLDGGLGAGKTCLTGGLAAALEIPEPVVSPTYTLVNEYFSGKIPLFHYDAYRLSSGDELYDIGFSEHEDNGIIVIEWSKNVDSVLPDDCIRVVIQRMDEISEAQRKIYMYIGKERGESLARLIS